MLEFLKSLICTAAPQSTVMPQSSAVILGAVIALIAALATAFVNQHFLNKRLEVEGKREREREDRQRKREKEIEEIKRIDAMYLNYIFVIHEVNAKIVGLNKAIAKCQDFNLEKSFDELINRLLVLRKDSELYYHDQSYKLINDSAKMIEGTISFLTCFQKSNQVINSAEQLKNGVLKSLQELKDFFDNHEKEYKEFLHNQMPK